MQGKMITALCLLITIATINCYPYEKAESFASFDQHVGHGGHAAHHYEDAHHDDHHAQINYKFGYAVKDPHTGDNKEAWESRDGDIVKGQYSLIDSDGTKRIVDYQADKHNGFNAVVKTIGHHGSTVEHHGHSY